MEGLRLPFTRTGGVLLLLVILTLSLTLILTLTLTPALTLMQHPQTRFLPEHQIDSQALYGAAVDCRQRVG